MSVISLANNDPIVQSKAYVGGVISTGAAKGEAEAEGSDTARIGSSTAGSTGATVTADSVYVTASSVDHPDTTTKTGAGGILAGSGSVGDANANSTVTAYVGTSSSVTATNAASVTATAAPQAQAEADGVNAGGLTVGVSKGTAEASPTVSAFVADGAVSAPTVVTVGKTVTGNVTFSHTGEMTGTGDVTFTHNGSLSGTPNLTFSNNGQYINSSGQTTFASNGTISGTPTLTFSNNGNTSFNGTLSFHNSQTLTGSPTITFQPNGDFSGNASTTLTFTNNGSNADTIARSSGNWLSEGFAAGQAIVITNTANNNLTVHIASLTKDTLTLTETGKLTNETINEQLDRACHSQPARHHHPQARGAGSRTASRRTA